jgi:EAL domain-containing protein (putative c-di-GMP-specific phosphodiesterase class I)
MRISSCKWIPTAGKDSTVVTRSAAWTVGPERQHSPAVADSTWGRPLSASPADRSTVPNTSSHDKLGVSSGDLDWSVTTSDRRRCLTVSVDSCKTRAWNRCRGHGRTTGERVQTDQQRRQHTSASHYLGLALADSILEHTVALAAERFGFAAGLVNILDAGSQHTVAAAGAALDTVARVGTLCDAVVRSGVPAVRGDIRDRFAYAPSVRAYVGVPISGREGVVIGTLSLLDTRPHTFSSAQMTNLIAMASVVEDQLEMLRRRGSSPLREGTAASSLTGAVDRREIVPFYQPLVDLGTGRVSGFEALARWRHPERGLLAPVDFIPLAEDTDIILELDRLVIAQAFEDVAPWLATDPDLGVSVNLSSRHFEQTDAIGYIRTLAEAAAINPASVTLEVTETVILAADQRDRSHIMELREAGFRVVLDDFGTGFSSFEHVLRLPIDGLKLDRAVTHELGTRAGDAVTRALVGLARDLELALVIEGVETRVEADIAQRLGCGQAQGFLWSAPVPAAEVPAILAANHWHPELSAIVPSPGRSGDRVGDAVS